MTLWKCTNCGYLHEGDDAPEQCPKCGAPKEAFEQLSEEAENTVQKARETNDAHMSLLATLEQASELAEVIHQENLDPGCTAIAERSMQDFEEIIQAIKAELQTHMQKGKWG